MENYEIITKIGSGACGAVYLARSHENGKQYALKKVQLDEQKKTRTREALLKEARILAQLKHPHIVVYHDSFFDGNADADFMHIVQDYCDGGTLDDKIAQMRKEEKFCDESTIMEWFIQIAMAVQYIHSNKILHRDLKSQNVFMTKTDGVKLGDFGIAKVLDSTLDAAMTCVGTPCYLSPELCQDIPYSSKSDIWALGCLLFELCALKPAFDAHNLISLFYKITSAQYSELPSHYSSEIKELIKTILIKEPENRPSASAILNLPMVRNYLEIFIQDREYLLQQRIISLKAKSSSQSGSYSPTFQHCKEKSSHENLHLKTVRQSTPNIKSKLMTSLPPLRKSHDPASTSHPCHAAQNTNAGDQPPGGKPPVSPTYSDDFDSSSSSSTSDKEDEIPEELCSPADSSADTGIDDGKMLLAVPQSDAVINSCLADDMVAGGDNYDDDFEEDSEAEELDDIICKAREAHTLAPQDEYIVDAKPSILTPNKQSIKEYLESFLCEGD